MVDTKVPFEVPEQMREFADRSIDQARKAFDHFMDATETAVSSMEGASNPMQVDSAGMHRQALTFAEQNVNSAFELAQRMFQAQNMEELVGLQTEYLHKQMELSGAQVREMGEKASQAVNEVAKKAGEFQ
ncbi:phasin family protein [Pseudovibrio sp. Tun.PSC04-5.I4]|uniref:phasin family protein n=1 Tax=Pseudovibrio sp. Tun.PSC04-5.I4 TaxID=1798213 RepID=UPI00088628D9|nr:phasin family protein [Pseudovibrio sp. Tun.PSC04-5.I4]SDQ71173.1 phasin [Pseudovibrio sp. Tun.PSC04-5.I4]